MPFSSLSPQQRVTILLQLLGGPQYRAQMDAAAASTGRLRKETNATGFAMTNTSRKTWLQNQALFTLRRYAFYATLAITAAAVGVTRLGLTYLSSMQQARVALQPVFSSTAELTSKLNELFRISKYSPFVLSDMTQAFRQMYGAMNPLGISADTVTTTIKSMVDALAFAGRTSPGALNRVAVALQHMAFMGRLQGYTVTQLARDGLPIYAALNKELGITGTQLHNIASLNISTLDVLNALNRYIETTPGYAGAATRISLQTVHGMIQVLRDSASQIMGIFLQRPFGGFQSGLFDLVKPGGVLDKLTATAAARGPSAAVLQLSDMIFGSKGIGRGILLLANIVTNLASVITHELVPAFAISLHSLIIFWPILQLINQGLLLMSHHSHLVIGVLVPLATLFILEHSAMLGVWAATKLLSIATFGYSALLRRLFIGLVLLTTAQGREIALAKLQFLWSLRNVAGLRAWAFATVFVKDEQTGFMVKQLASMSLAARFTRAMFLAARGVKALSIALVAGGRAMLLFLLTNPIGWAILFIGLMVTLYFKWKAFHDAVNSTFQFMERNAWAVSAALTIAFGPLGAALSSLLLIIKYWKQIKDMAHHPLGYGSPQATAAYEAANSGKHKSWWQRFLGTLRSGTVIPGRAVGGSVFTGRPYLVGEYGPELFMPNMSGTIVPNNLTEGVLAGYGTTTSNDDGRPIVVQLVVDRKVLAESVARARQDKQARR